MPATKIYGLIGRPIKHSFSSLMHNAAFAHLKIDARYELFPLKEDEVFDFLKNLKKNNIFGLNVTAPYKEKVVSFIENVSDEARLVGAVNTIKAAEDGLKGFNTDGEGFLRALTEDLGFSPADKAVALIGAGGAAHAVGACLCRARPRVISIYDIDKTRLALLTARLEKNFQGIEIKKAGSLAELNIQNADLLVNATPAGMKKTDPCPVSGKLIHKDLLVFDLIYNPPETKLLETARKKGARVSNGLGMFVYQGAAAFEIWMGKKAPLDVLRRVLNRRIK